MAKPTLTIDARCAHSGMGRYLRILLEAVRSQDDFQVRLIISPADRERREFIGFAVRIVQAGMYSAAEQLSLPLGAAGSRLFHVPNYNLPVFYPGRMLTTIYDTTHLAYPAYSTTLASRVYSRQMMRLAARRAAGVVTISHYSARQIQERLGIAASKISVTYLAPDPALRPLLPDHARCLAREEAGLNGPYFLYVGGLRPHKNIPGLLKGFSRFLGQSRWAGTLVLAGCDPKHSQEARTGIDRLGLQGRVLMLANPPDRLLAALYGAAAGFVTASLSEGFCLPAIEAMRCGAPVACSDATCLPEIVGDAALLFDAKDPDALAAALASILDQATRRALLTRGRARADWFDRQDVAGQHRDIYRRMMGLGSGGERR